MVGTHVRKILKTFTTPEQVVRAADGDFVDIPERVGLQLLELVEINIVSNTPNPFGRVAKQSLTIGSPVTSSERTPRGVHGETIADTKGVGTWRGTFQHNVYVRTPRETIIMQCQHSQVTLQWPINVTSQND